MANDQEAAVAAEPRSPSRGSPVAAPPPEGGAESLRKWADVSAKLIGALAIAGVTWVVAGLESTVTSVDLLAKREQAETDLRASMFTALIDPVFGPPIENHRLDAERQRLLIELLTLNFHDHIEFKPLLIHVDALLAQEVGSTEADEGRQSLRSVARRVIDRQINALSVSAYSMGLSSIEPVEMHFEGDPTGKWTPDSGCQKGTQSNKANLLEMVCANTHDGKYQLRVFVTEIDFQRATVRIYLEIYEAASDTFVDDADFTLTHFDFPLTDNAQIDPDHRFSIVLYQIEPQDHSIELRLVWFPKGYVTPQERPIDYLSLRDTLGLNKGHSRWRTFLGLE